jgi:hypothetical protein
VSTALPDRHHSLLLPLTPLLAPQLTSSLTSHSLTHNCHCRRHRRQLSNYHNGRYPEVMKRGCECVSALGKAAPRRFYGGSKPLSKPLLKALQHQHSKVRVQALGAVEGLCLYGDKETLSEFMVRSHARARAHTHTHTCHVPFATVCLARLPPLSYACITNMPITVRPYTHITHSRFCH